MKCLASRDVMYLDSTEGIVKKMKNYFRLQQPFGHLLHIQGL